MHAPVQENLLHEMEEQVCGVSGGPESGGLCIVCLYLCSVLHHQRTLPELHYHGHMGTSIGAVRVEQ